jgi:hypothetical protein
VHWRGLFTQAELTEDMLPVPAHLFAARKLDGDAREMKQATMRFVHALLVSTADASRFGAPNPRVSDGFYREKSFVGRAGAVAPSVTTVL